MSEVPTHLRVCLLVLKEFMAESRVFQRKELSATMIWVSIPPHSST